MVARRHGSGCNIRLRRRRTGFRGGLGNRTRSESFARSLVSRPIVLLALLAAIVRSLAAATGA